MASFEVHRYSSDGRWLLDAIFDDPAAAVENAKTLMTRARGPTAVRVLVVEERESGFYERVIYHDSTTVRYGGDATIIEAPRPPIVPLNLKRMVDVTEPDSYVVESTTAGGDEDILAPAEMAEPPVLRATPMPRTTPAVRVRRLSKARRSRLRTAAAWAAIAISVAIVSWEIYQAASAQDTWVFNRREAHKRNPLQNPWSGEISR